jgi:hypothetical protein
VPLKDLSHGEGDCAIASEVRRDKDCFGAEPFGTAGRHGRVNPKTPRFIGSSTHNGAITAPRDDDRSSAQARIITLLDRGIERVHIYVNNFANHDSAP